MRDKCKGYSYSSCYDGIIPAYAGQIDEHTEGFSKARDHPRIRGTNYLSFDSDRLAKGSSPHTRDKFQSFMDFETAARIIPAYAGQMSMPFFYFF